MCIMISEIASLPLGIFSFSLQPFFPFTFAFTKFLLLESLMVTVFAFIWSTIPSINIFMLDSDFQHFHFLFFPAVSSLVANSLFWLSTFVKCCLSLSLGDKDTAQLHTLLSMCELSNRCSVTNHEQTLRRSDAISLIMMHIFYLCNILWTEVASKFVLCAITHIEYTIVTEI